MTRVEILSTHPDILKLGIRSTEPSMLELINNAKDELQILSYAITSGANKILLAIEKALSKGIKLTFVLNSNEQLNESVIHSLTKMKNTFEYSKTYLFDSNANADLHAKIMIADRKVAIVGSSNLTSRGLLWNLEIGFLIEDESVWKLSEIIDRIVEMSKPL
ncbi:MAG: phospholipase D-like domain-containing protein [Thermoplasmatales archaeon]